LGEELYNISYGRQRRLTNTWGSAGEVCENNGLVKEDLQDSNKLLKWYVHCLKLTPVTFLNNFLNIGHY